MNLKPTVTYYLKNSAKVFMLYYIIMIIVNIFFAGLFITINSNGETTSSANEMLTAGVILIIGLCSFKDELHFFLQNGVSRRTTFLSFLLHLGILCAAAAAAEMILGAILHGLMYNFSQYTYVSYFDMFYSQRTVFTGAVSGGILNYFWNFALFLIAGTAGYLLTNIYYLWGKWGKIIFSICLWGGLFIALPIVDANVFGYAITLALARFMDFVMGASRGWNPLYFIVTCTAGAAIAAACTWPMTRRARIKKD